VRRFGLLFLAVCLAGVLWAQAPVSGGAGAAGGPVGEPADEWDIDSLFDEAPPDSDGTGVSGGQGSGAGEPGLAGMVRKRGFRLDASYYFYGAVSPGWDEAPWHWDDVDETYSTILGAGMSSALGLDFQISEHLRVKNLFTFTAPGLAFTVKEIFIDYSLWDRVFFRGGKFTRHWGISPNYSHADLLSRLPPNNAGGDPYIVRLDIPVGIGGVELLALTRPGFMGNAALPSFDEVGFGGKYNLAYRWADIDVGVFYHSGMPLRNFVSIKSTVLNTEVYAEGMVSIRHTPWGAAQGSGSAGFVRNFFSGALTVNGEYFYNGENDAWYFAPETNLEEAETERLVFGHNVAINVLYRTGAFWDLRLMARCFYAVSENSVQLVPGLSLAPLPNVLLSLGVPMALGSRDGAYYRRNADRGNRPFSMVLLVSIGGDYRFSPDP
jgi:hypothetical protein